MKNNYKVLRVFLSAVAMLLLVACDNDPGATDSQLAQQVDNGPGRGGAAIRDVA